MAGTREGMLKAWDTRGRSQETETGEQDTISDLMTNGLKKEEAEKCVQDVKAYTVTTFVAINGNLRTDTIGNEATESATKSMDTFLEKAPKMQVAELYRGVPASISNNLEIGKVYTDKGFMSTSADKDVTFDMMDEDGLLMVIKKPKNAVSVDHISGCGGQKEAIMPRNSRFRITGFSQLGKHRVVEMVQLEKPKVDARGNYVYK